MKPRRRSIILLHLLITKTFAQSFSSNIALKDVRSHLKQVENIRELFGRILQIEHKHHHDDHHHHHHPTKRCGMTENPPLIEMLTMQENFESFRERTRMNKDIDTGWNKKGKTINVYVYVHVFYRSDNEGFISQQTILQQIKVLNDAFSGDVKKSMSKLNKCAGLFEYGQTFSSPFRFVLLQINYIKDDDAFVLSSRHSLNKQRLERVGECSDLNIFTGTDVEKDSMGISSKPSECRDNKFEDRIQVHYQTFPGMGMRFFDEGDTVVHEIGHWLGLYHTFQGGCSGYGDDVPLIGDGVYDTPPEAEASYTCPVGRDTCGGDGVDPIHNYMDYSYDCCMYQFTESQIERMIFIGEYFRDLQYDPTPAPTEIPTKFPTKFPTRKPSHSPSISTSNPTIRRAISPPLTPSTSNTLPNTSNMPPNTPNSSNQGCGKPFIKFFKKMKLNNALYRIMIHD